MAQNKLRIKGASLTGLLLDKYPNAAVAYSLRKLRKPYTGAAIRVRRSSDNAEQDINFVGNDLDTQSLLDFVGYNLFTYSEDISVTASWAGTNINRTGTPPYVDVETAPDSTLTGDKLIENSTSGSHFISRFNTAFAIGSDYNISVYLKPAERTMVYIDSQISGAYQNATVDLSTGSVVSTTFANTPVITAEANGWYRFSVTINAGATSVVPIRVMLNNGTTTSYTGDGTSGAYVWGFQLSRTSSVKTYQKTTAVAGGNGFVTTWYDQSTNANNATQTTAANQAQIVSSGAVITDPDTGKITTSWTSDSYILGSNVAVTQNMLVSGVVNRTATVTSQWLLGHNAATPRLVGVSNSGNIISQITTANTAITHGNITTGAFIISGLRDSSNIVKAWTNTTALTTGTSTGVSGNFSRFGFQNTVGTTGRIVEMIFWDNDKESSRANIVANQNDYWNVY